MTLQTNVIAIDGPVGSGKGTISQLLAKKLDWHLLDSGALYRVLAYAAVEKNIALDNISDLVSLIPSLKIRFTSDDYREPASVWLNDQNISKVIRSEEMGKYASQVAVYPKVREALLDLQRGFCQSPGLVADGRDMGTVVFPKAFLKVFLTASVEARAHRRFGQLLVAGIDVKLADLIDEITKRDTRDQERTVSPLKAAEDAVVMDTTHMDIDAVMNRVWQMVEERLTHQK